MRQAEVVVSLRQFSSWSPPARSRSLGFRPVVVSGLDVKMCTPLGSDDFTFNPFRQIEIFGCMARLLVCAIRLRKKQTRAIPAIPNLTKASFITV
jgi:hypothetical protein